MVKTEKKNYFYFINFHENKLVIKKPKSVHKFLFYILYVHYNLNIYVIGSLNIKQLYSQIKYITI